MNCLRPAAPVGKEHAADKVDAMHNGNPKMRSWSSSHVDSLGDSNNSKASLDISEETRHIRLQQIFFQSVVQNDLDMVIRCLHHGADVTEEYLPLSQTVLHAAARRGHHKIVEFLLRNAAANPNTLDEKAFLPLHYACQEGHVTTVKILLLYGSLVTVENEYGDSPLHTATRYGHSNLLVLLLAIDLRREYGRRKMEHAYMGQRHINLQNANNDTALHIACALNRKSIVKSFLQWGADTTIKNHQNLSPLQVALDKGHSGIVKLLRASPFIIAPQQPSSSAEQQPAQNPQYNDTGLHPFRNYEGLQKYTEEMIRTRSNGSSASPGDVQNTSTGVVNGNNNAHIQNTRAYMEPISPRVRAPASSDAGDSIDAGVIRTYNGQPMIRGGSQQRTYTSFRDRSLSPPGSYSRPPIGLVTKTIGLDPQPNNVHEHAQMEPIEQANGFYSVARGSLTNGIRGAVQDNGHMSGRRSDIQSPLSVLPLSQEQEELLYQQHQEQYNQPHYYNLPPSTTTGLSSSTVNITMTSSARLAASTSVGPANAVTARSMDARINELGRTSPINPDLLSYTQAPSAQSQANLNNPGLIGGIAVTSVGPASAITARSMDANLNQLLEENPIMSPVESEKLPVRTKDCEAQTTEYIDTPNTESRQEMSTDVPADEAGLNRHHHHHHKNKDKKKEKKEKKKIKIIYEDKVTGTESVHIAPGEYHYPATDREGHKEFKSNESGILKKGAGTTSVSTPALSKIDDDFTSPDSFNETGNVNANRVIIVREVTSPAPNSDQKNRRTISIKSNNDSFINGKESTVAESKSPDQEVIMLNEETPTPYDSFVTGVTKNGKRYIKKAPTMSDVYASRVGRVSPKIRGLQEQLRKSQQRLNTYEFSE